MFKLYDPYRESDHVLNLAYNVLCDGEQLQDIEGRDWAATLDQGGCGDHLPTGSPNRIRSNDQRSLQNLKS